VGTATLITSDGDALPSNAGENQLRKDCVFLLLFRASDAQVNSNLRARCHLPLAAPFFHSDFQALGANIAFRSRYKALLPTTLYFPVSFLFLLLLCRICASVTLITRL